jgi:hypothetical protein
MDTTPEEEADLVLLAFKNITTQLEKLDERDKRAEVREQQVMQRQQTIIEHQNKLNGVMLKIVEKADNFQQNMVDIETRTKSYLSDYFKDLPKKNLVVHEKRLSVDMSVKQLVFFSLFIILVSGLFVYFASPQVDILRLEYQDRRVQQLEQEVTNLKTQLEEAKSPKKKKRRKN